MTMEAKNTAMALITCWLNKDEEGLLILLEMTTPAEKLMIIEKLMIFIQLFVDVIVDQTNSTPLEYWQKLCQDLAELDN